MPLKGGVMPLGRSHFLVTLLALFSAAAPARAAWQPYVIGAGGEYAVIDPSSNSVVSQGNIFEDLMSNPQISSKWSFLSDRHDIGSFYMDPSHDRIFLFTGKRDEYTDGVLILRMSDRSFLAYTPYHWNRWGGDEMFVSDKNLIFYQGEKGMLVYDGITYTKDHKDITWPYHDGGTCFIPGTSIVYDRRYGFYDLDNYVKDRFGDVDNKILKGKIGVVKSHNAEQVDCRNGKILLKETDQAVKLGESPKMMVYDLKTEKVISKFYPENIEGWSSYYWQLSHDGQYAIWNDLIEVRMDSGEKNAFHNGHVVVCNSSSGEKIGEITLPAKTEEDLRNFKDYDFKGYSADDKKMLVYSDPYLYVVGINKPSISNKIKLPFTPGWYNSTGFVVWP